MNEARRQRVSAFIGERLGALEGAGDMRALFACVEQNGRRRFAAADGGELRYDELCLRARQAAASFAMLPDGPVGIHLPNCPQWAIAFWGALIAGHAPLLLDASAPLEAHGRALSAAGAVAAVSPDRQFTALPVLPPVFPAASAFVPEQWENRVLLMTSGTTGAAKMVEFDGAALIAQMRAARDMGEETTEIVYPAAHGAMRQLALLPFHHVFGFAACFLWYSFFGAQFVFPREKSPERLFQLCRETRATHIFAVPQFFLRVLLEADGIARRLFPREAGPLLHWLKTGFAADGPSIDRFEKLCVRLRRHLLGTQIRFLITGGAASSRAAMGMLNRMGYTLVNGYGMTELGIVAVELSMDRERRRRALIGSPLYGVRFALGEDGELFADAGCAAARALEDGAWRPLPRPFPTGDLAERDPSGGYRLIGRKRDLLLSDNGENVFPAELEEPLEGTPGVRSLCALLSPEGRGLALAAEMDAAANEAPLLSAVRNLNAMLPLSRRIQAVYRTDLPLRSGAKGEVNRQSVASLLNDCPARFARLSPGAAEDAPGARLSGRVRALFADALQRKEEGIGFFDHFLFDLGGDSFLYAGLLSRIEREFGITIPDGERSAYLTVRDAALNIEGHGGK
ncbi:MAG: AMP-binding protein [Clostridiales bacterium]|nr:AMP-binding protein [Clostridiales bacterium]